MSSGSDTLMLQSLRSAIQGGYIWQSVISHNQCTISKWNGFSGISSDSTHTTSVGTFTTKVLVLKKCSCKIKCEPPCLCCVSNITYIVLCGCFYQGRCFGRHKKKQIKQQAKFEDTSLKC